MEIENLEYKSKLGKPSVYTYRHHSDEAKYLAILLPGQAYFKDAPLMWYAALATFQAGVDTLSVEYGYQANRVSLDGAKFKITLEDLKSSLLDFLSKHTYERIIMISKSIGTQFASQIGGIGAYEVWRHIFLTPLRSTIEFMRNGNEALVVVGEKDPLFLAEDLNEVARMKNVEILTIAEADHLLEIQGDYGKSLRALEMVAGRCHDYIKQQISRVSD